MDHPSLHFSLSNVITPTPRGISHGGPYLIGSDQRDLYSIVRSWIACKRARREPSYRQGMKGVNSDRTVLARVPSQRGESFGYVRAIIITMNTLPLSRTYPDVRESLGTRQTFPCFYCSFGPKKKVHIFMIYCCWILLVRIFTPS